jgi:hypothetical protein
VVSESKSHRVKQVSGGWVNAQKLTSKPQRKASPSCKLDLATIALELGWYAFVFGGMPNNVQSFQDSDSGAVGSTPSVDGTKTLEITTNHWSRVHILFPLTRLSSTPADPSACQEDYKDYSLFLSSHVTSTDFIFGKRPHLLGPDEQFMCVLDATGCDTIVPFPTRYQSISASMFSAGR